MTIDASVYKFDTQSLLGLKHFHQSPLPPLLILLLPCQQLFFSLSYSISVQNFEKYGKLVRPTDVKHPAF